MLEALLGAALRTSLLALLVALGLQVLRIRHPQLLLAAWTAVLVASLTMPVLQRFTPLAIPLGVDRPILLLDAGIQHPVTPHRRPGQSGPALFVPALSVTAGAALPAPVRDPERWLTVGYLIVAGVMVCRLLMGLVLSWRLLRKSRPIAADWGGGGTVHASAAISAPVSVGGHILLPTDCMDWPLATRRAVLAHEMAHIDGGDFYVLLLSLLNRALFWFNPLSWWLHRRLAMLAESACDDAAMATSDDGPGYAAILLEMAGRPGRVPGGVAMARPATVDRRIARILAQPRSTPIERRRRLACALGVVPLALATTISLAGAAPPDKAALDQQREPHTPIAIDSKLLDAYAGYYRNADTGSVMIVTREGNHLLTHRAGYPPVPEFPYTDHDFFLTVGAQQNSFITDGSGTVVSVVHHQMGHAEMLQRLSDEDGKREAALVNQRFDAERATHAEVTIDPALLDGYVGAYQLTPRLIFTVTRDGNKLLAQLTGQRTFEVHPYSDHDFFYTVVAAQLTFVAGPNGKASAVILHQNGRDRTAERVDPGLAKTLDQKLSEQREAHTPIAIDPRLIDRYVGRYLNDKIEITVTREGNQMFAQTTGYGRVPVYPFTDHDFFATIAPAQFTFVASGNDKASQLIRHRFGRDAVLNRVE